jgi:hypothetical protein
MGKNKEKRYEMIKKKSVTYFVGHWQVAVLASASSGVGDDWMTHFAPGGHLRRAHGSGLSDGNK